MLYCGDGVESLPSLLLDDPVQSKNLLAPFCLTVTKLLSLSFSTTIWHRPR